MGSDEETRRSMNNGCSCDECERVRLADEARRERHEFHMLDAYNAYCICGWQISEDRPLDLGQRYREHLLEDAANE